MSSFSSSSSSTSLTSLSRANELEDATVPKVGSALYTRKDYWDARFAVEEEHEWLAGWADSPFREAVENRVPREVQGDGGGGKRATRVLLVGCGNSRLPIDMAMAGYSAIVATDYSEPLIAKLREKWGGGGSTLLPSSSSERPPFSQSAVASIRWEVADMTSLANFPDGSFDVVLDKAAMDAILADGGDVWDPPQSLLDSAAAVCASVSRVLVKGGLFLQLSFSQPHFRAKYLLQKTTKRKGGDDEEEGEEIAAGAAKSPSSSTSSCAAAALQPSSAATGAEGSNLSDDEWEPDARPDIVPGKGISSFGRVVEVEGTHWSSFEAVPIAVGFGYHLFVMRTPSSSHS